MNRNQNLILLVVVVVTGALGYYVSNNSISLKGYFNNYASPYGPKPSRTWESNWEKERLK